MQTLFFMFTVSYSTEKKLKWRNRTEVDLDTTVRHLGQDSKGNGTVMVLQGRDVVVPQGQFSPGIDLYGIKG